MTLFTNNIWFLTIFILNLILLRSAFLACAFYSFVCISNLIRQNDLKINWNGIERQMKQRKSAARVLKQTYFVRQKTYKAINSANGLEITNPLRRWNIELKSIFTVRRRDQKQTAFL